jgi:hypothetical protein
MQKRLYSELNIQLQQVKERQGADKAFYTRLESTLRDAYDQLKTGFICGTQAGIDDYHQYAKHLKEIINLINENKMAVGQEILGDIKKNIGL